MAQTKIKPDMIDSATKGNILVANGTEIIEVTVGANDTVLTADSGETSGVKWAAGGVSLIDSVGYQQGGWSAGSSATAMLGWGLIDVPTETDATSTNGSDSGGVYLEQHPDGTVGDFAGTYNDISVEAQHLPTFYIKFAEEATFGSNQLFSAGLCEDFADTWTSGDAFIGLIRDTIGNYKFVTSTTTVGNNTQTDTGISYTLDKVLILVVQVVSSSEVKFWLYDEDYTELDSATHTTNIPTTPMGFQSLTDDREGDTGNGIRNYAANIKLRN
jgi:hypothetical protein